MQNRTKLSLLLLLGTAQHAAQAAVEKHPVVVTQEELNSALKEAQAAKNKLNELNKDREEYLQETYPPASRKLKTLESEWNKEAENLWQKMEQLNTEYMNLERQFTSQYNQLMAPLPRNNKYEKNIQAAAQATHMAYAHYNQLLALYNQERQPQQTMLPWSTAHTSFWHNGQFNDGLKMPQALDKVDVAQLANKAKAYTLAPGTYTDMIPSVPNTGGVWSRPDFVVGYDLTPLKSQETKVSPNQAQLTSRFVKNSGAQQGGSIGTTEYTLIIPQNAPAGSFAVMAEHRDTTQTVLFTVNIAAKKHVSGYKKK